VLTPEGSQLGPPGANAGKFTGRELAESFSIWPEDLAGPKVLKNRCDYLSLDAQVFCS
jgi:hypothetical protein